LELKDKLRKGAVDESPTLAGNTGNTTRQEALNALMTLGIPRAASEKSIENVLKKAGNTVSLEDLVKQALKNA